MLHILKDFFAAHRFCDVNAFTPLLRAHFHLKLCNALDCVFGMLHVAVTIFERELNKNDLRSNLIK